MFRFFSLIARRPSVAEQEFHDHWRFPHGVMGRRIGGLRDYVQAHRIPSDLIPREEWPLQGVAISGFDNLASARALLTDSMYVDHVQPDEPGFQDLERNIFFFTEEEVIQSRPGPEGGLAYDLWNDLESPSSIQLLQFIRTSGDPRWDTADDVEIGRRLGAFRQAKNRPVFDWHGANPPFLGVRQFWWPTITQFERAIERDPSAVDDLRLSAGDSLLMLTSSERWLR